MEKNEHVHESIKAAIETIQQFIVEVTGEEATQEEMAALLQESINRKVLGPGARRYILTAESNIALAQKHITSLSYIPYINLDEEIIRKRFGEPAERIIVDQKRQHLLYPALGLDLVLDEDGKELLQYVAPAQFEIRWDTAAVTAIGHVSKKRDLAKLEGKQKHGDRQQKLTVQQSQ